MKMTYRNSRTLFSLLLLPVIVLLMVGSLMLFNFFRNKTLSGIEEERRSLETHVLQTYFREYQRFLLVIQSVRQITAPGEEEVKQNIQSLMDLYSREGRLPGLVREAAYIKSDDKGTIYILDQEKKWGSQGMAPFAAPPPIEEEMESGDALLFNRKDEISGTDRTYLRYIPAGQENYLIQVELDWQNLEEIYVKPAVAQSLRGYELEWTFKEEDSNKEFNFFERPAPEEYRFSPLRALLNSSYKENEDCLIFLPAPMRARKPVIISENLSLESSPQDISRELFSRMDREVYRDSGQLLLIGEMHAPFYREIERDNAVSWLESMIFLYGIGGIFLIIAAQLARLKHLREKEKEFVASMTHELRTPLTVIQSAADNLNRGIIPPERINQYGSLIKDQVLRLGTMIEEILLFSSIEGRTKAPEPVRVELKRLIEEIQQSTESLAERHNVRVKWETQGLAPVYLTDPDTLRLGLNNLLMNALNHAYPDSPGTIRVKIRFSIPASLIVTVEDEGRGIAPAEQKKVLTPFYRDRYSRQNQEKGSGLGLFITAKKAAAAGGSLKLESPYKKIDGTKQRGCRFVFTINCKIVDENLIREENI